MDKKLKVKYFRGYMTSSKYFYLEHISYIASNNSLFANANVVEQSIAVNY